MRRRDPINVWPAIADLMTVLAVPALCVSVGAIPFLPSASSHGGRERVYHGVLREKAKNERMFRAIQEAEDLVSEIRKDRRLEPYLQDQILRFGDDLVSFERNGFEPQWKEGSLERLQTLCAAVSLALQRRGQRGEELRRHFLILVEGHTDRSRCSSDPHCNWWFSSGRAAAFVATLRQPSVCKGAERWKLRPIGLADTMPVRSTAAQDAELRRVAIRIVPDYETIMAAYGTLLPDA